MPHSHTNASPPLSIEDMCLTFTLPGHSIPLLPQGESRDVDSSSLPLYLQRLLHVSLVESVSPQLQALAQGFHDIVPKGAVAECFTSEELATMLGGKQPQSVNSSLDLRKVFEIATETVDTPPCTS